jgi:integrase
MASIRKKLTGAGARRFEVRWRDAVGRDRCKTFATERDARRFKVDVERRAQLGSLYDAGPTSFAEFLEGWLGRYEQRVRPATYDRGVQALRQVAHLRAYRTDQLRVGDVEDAITALARRAPRQAQIALQLIKQALRNAQERGHVIDAAILTLQSPRHAEGEPRFLTWAEVEGLASNCAEEQLIIFAALTGLRQGELFALRQAELDLAGRRVLIQASARNGKRGPTKNGRKRSVHLSTEAVRAAQEQLGRLGTQDRELLFASPMGVTWRKDNFMARVFRPAVRRTGLEGLTFHDLRHTYASLMVAAGVSAQVIADQLGHADARLVLQRYGHLYPGASERAALALDAYLLETAVGQAWGEAVDAREPDNETPADSEWSVRDLNPRPPACKAGCQFRSPGGRAYAVLAAGRQRASEAAIVFKSSANREGWRCASTEKSA